MAATGGNAFEVCEGIVRQHDPDRFISALFAPAQKRKHLFALYAFNHEIARVAESVTQPMLGEIRLQWWRETVEQARAGKPRSHDVAQALAETFAEIPLPFEPFDAMLDARIFDSSAEAFDTLESLEAYADATSGNLMRLASLILGAPNDALARDAGIAYALSGTARSLPFCAARGKTFLPAAMLRDVDLVPEDALSHTSAGPLRVVLTKLAEHARAHYSATRRLPKPRQALAAFLPAATVPLYLKRVSGPRFDPFRDTTDVPLYRRQLAMLGAAIRGRV